MFTVNVSTNFRKTIIVVIGGVAGWLALFGSAYCLTKVFFAPALAVPAYQRGMAQTAFFGMLFGVFSASAFLCDRENRQQRLLVAIPGLCVGGFFFVVFFAIFVIMTWFPPKVPPPASLIVQQAGVAILSPLTFTGAGVVFMLSVLLLMTRPKQSDLFLEQ
jgi:hypothetical protein